MPVFAGTRVPAKNLIDYLEHHGRCWSLMRLLLDECLPKQLKRERCSDSQPSDSMCS
jgi:hypothetical protein